MPLPLNPTPIPPGATPPTWLQGQFTNGNDVEMVPYPAGGPSDAIARIFNNALGGGLVQEIYFTEFAVQ